MADAVRRLEASRGVKPESLRDNPAFIDAVLTASAAAIRTSQEEKREALRNAILNAGLPAAPEVAVQQMFIGLVDRFTEWHLRILRLFQNPAEWRDGNRQLRATSSLASLFEQAYPALKDRRNLYDQIWADLRTAGLHHSADLGTMMTPHGTMAKRTNELGDQFLLFISDPISRS